MATFLRDLSYRYQWLYDTVSWSLALAVGGEERFRRLALEGLVIGSEMAVLDLCCGSGQATAVLVALSSQVTALDASPRSLARARHNVPEATYVEGFAEAIPLGDNCFDLVHVSAALHEMELQQLRQILAEVRRVLKPGGTFAIVDLHAPSNLIFWPGLAAFMGLFETETAWQFVRLDLAALLQDLGFAIAAQRFYAGGSLQVIQATSTR